MSSAVGEIPVTLRLSKDAEAKLSERAIAAGVSLPDYLSTMIESLVEEPRTIAEISGAVHQRFLDSGASEDELSEELERAKHEMRAERRGRQAP